MPVEVCIVVGGKKRQMIPLLQTGIYFRMIKQVFTAGSPDTISPLGNELNTAGEIFFQFIHQQGIMCTSE